MSPLFIHQFPFSRELPESATLDWELDIAHIQALIIYPATPLSYCIPNPFLQQSLLIQNDFQPNQKALVFPQSSPWLPQAVCSWMKNPLAGLKPTLLYLKAIRDHCQPVN